MIVARYNILDYTPKFTHPAYVSIHKKSVVNYDLSLVRIDQHF